MVQSRLLQRRKRPRRLLDVSHASNTAPSNVLSPTGSDNANYNAGTYNSPVYTDPVNYLTPVGTFAASPGPYGTF